MIHNVLFFCLLGAAAVSAYFKKNIPGQLLDSSQKADFNLEQYRNREIPEEAKNLHGDELIRYVNENQNLWTARRQRFFDNFEETTVRGLMGLKKSMTNGKEKAISSTKDLDISIPESFDAREQWKQCESIKAIRDQSSCGSCWAFGAVETMSDRICIESNGTIKEVMAEPPVLAVTSLVAMAKMILAAANLATALRLPITAQQVQVSLSDLLDELSAKCCQRPDNEAEDVYDFLKSMGYKASASYAKMAPLLTDLLSCCTDCGLGCNGGDMMQAFEFWVSDGIVTGSNFTTKQGCQPYPFPPCEHHSNKTHFQPCKHDLYPTPPCSNQCSPDYKEKTYAQDKHYGESAYMVDASVEAIQKEIMTNGPVEVGFMVYEDFENYDQGIYTHTAGQELGGHAVKMLGWGVEEGKPYWLVANSWNTDWGEDGFFRILRGVNECGVESEVVAGLPKL